MPKSRILIFSTDSGHICPGRGNKWVPIAASLCSSHSASVRSTESYAIPDIYNRCTNCSSKAIKEGVCEKCGTVMEWLKTNRPYYKNAGVV